MFSRLNALAGSAGYDFCFGIFALLFPTVVGLFSINCFECLNITENFIQFANEPMFRFPLNCDCFCSIFYLFFLILVFFLLALRFFLCGGKVNERTSYKS